MAKSSGKNGSKPLGAGFVVIVAFKYFKGLLFLVVGIAAIHLTRLAQIPSAQDIAHFLKTSPENELVRHAAAALAASDRAAQVGVLAFVVSAVFIAEGTLLTLRVWWATYLTITLTALGIPLEIYGIVRHPESLRHYAVLLLNVAILVFLWWHRNEFRKSGTGR